MNALELKIARYMEEYVPGEPAPGDTEGDTEYAFISFQVNQHEKQLIKSWSKRQGLNVSQAIRRQLEQAIPGFEHRDIWHGGARHKQY